MRSRSGKRGYATFGVVVLSIAVLSACSSSDSSSAAEATSSAASTGSTGSSSEGSTVAITLQEFAISADPGSVPAGTVNFDVTNIGPEDVHEFVVIRTDLGPTELPTDETGAALEEAAGVEPVDEIEDLAVDANETLTVDLEAGDYVLICNIYSEKEQEAHYAEGMRIGFTVE